MTRDEAVDVIVIKIMQERHGAKGRMTLPQWGALLKELFDKVAAHSEAGSPVVPVSEQPR